MVMIRAPFMPAASLPFIALEGATFDSGNLGGGLTLSGGDLIVSESGSNDFSYALSDDATVSGLYYAEFEVTAGWSFSAAHVGIASTSYTHGSPDGSITARSNNGVAWDSRDLLYTKTGSSSLSMGTYGAGDIIGVAINSTNGKVWFSKNGVWVLSGDPLTDSNPTHTLTTPDTWRFLGGGFTNSGSGSITARFNNSSWTEL